MLTVTQAELVAYVAEDTGLPKVDVKRVLDMVAESVAGAVSRGNAVNLHGIVKVYPAYVKPLPRRKARNPFDPSAPEKWVKARPEGVKVKATVLAKAKAQLPKTFKGKTAQATLAAVRPKAKKGKK